MKIDFTVGLKSLSGEPFETSDDVDEKGKPKNVRPMMLADVVSGALLNQVTEADRTITGEEKFKRFQLAQKIVGKTEPVDVTGDEITKIKKRIGEVCSPALVGPAWELLEV